MKVLVPFLIFQFQNLLLNNIIFGQEYRKNELEKILVISDSSLNYKVDDIESNFPLGLKICRMYIQSLDGKFQMESSPNQGTNLSFSVLLK